MTVRYGVTIEFTVDSVLDGGPSKAEVRRFLREAVANEGYRLQAQHGINRFTSLHSIGIKYLHEASTATNPKARGPR